MKKIIVSLLFCLCQFLSAEEALRLGILAFRPKEQALSQWQPFATYLQDTIKKPIALHIYNYPEFTHAVANHEVDIILTNPGHYIVLKNRHKLSAPLVTQITQKNHTILTQFAGVIFTRHDSPLRALNDLKNVKIAVTNTDSLGGYQMQAYELALKGIMPKQTHLVITGMPHDKVIESVLSRKADVGFVRTNVVEDMREEGKLALSDIKIINEQNDLNFPYIRSTRLYPEWPLVVVAGFDEHVARALTVALLALSPESEAARSAQIYGFTVPADYKGVEDALRTLRVPPFEGAPKFTLADFWARYANHIALMLFAFLIFLMSVGFQLYRQNKRIRHNEKHLLLVQDNLQSTLDAIPDALFEMSLDGVYFRVGRAHANVSASLSQEMMGKNVYEIYPKDVADIFIQALREADQEGHAFGYQFSIEENAKTLWFELSVSKKKESHEVAHFIVLSHEITHRKEAEAKLKLAASVFTYAREGIMITNASGEIVEVNDTFTCITGYEHQEVVGQNPRLLKSGRQSESFYKQMWQSLLEKGHWYGEISNRRKSGEVYVQMTSISAIYDEHEVVQSYVALFTDITTMKEHEKQLEYVAHYDALTSLPNRVLFADRLRQAMAQTERRKKELAVVYLDLDGFKVINDQYGHHVGDELLVIIAERMQEALRQGDTISRLGGDEFVAVLTDLSNQDECIPILDRLLKATSDPIVIDKNIIQVSSSIGVTLYPKDGVDADQLLRHADLAMYQSKQSGKNRYHFFDVESDRAIKKHNESLESILSAIINDEFLLYYQPKVNLETRELVSVEALIRWQHPEKGFLLPHAFLPIVEDHVLSIRLGEWVIERAFKQMSAWIKEGLSLSVSINVGARQLQDSSFTEYLQTMLLRYPDVPAHLVELEILETSALEDMVHVSQIMHACKSLGVRFALDDFGTGYSSLSYLRKLPIDILKIDQSFICNLLHDNDDLAIVEAIVGLSKAFDLHVIAEGVETQEHAELLLKHGCELAQGFGIARPMHPDAIIAWKDSSLYM
ncbi:EAL domain-containing protein [Sulfurospirillum multivorans]|uniref:Diguanylate cyclase/phosphodiesterase (GGDEF & EAL domains) with PAS/PAC sensor(S) n=2 Tax=Sulfurospirillum multivorans TaxID=66821 RepID=A0AA86ALV2_SULMK|nr:EAL domain-containing protein [Sulfurospirillum multivorans]AHJ11876.1 diguanylate cyclase/phosphodiesterase (GGDEF & EAL domains) with PAS/PAC sensor(s) [Sulfurospirillum multivorans DSM 12446]QEH05382.1 diguanylate cyclase/phosphodiesterase (GGDEF & EAL domains) with PAS/PAC sensor(s) [Sulfurospirillum multivorans]